MRKLFLLLFLLVVVFASNSNAQQAGTLDTTFGVGGRVLLNLPLSSNGSVIALQTDGKIVFAGGIFVGRLKTDGTLDTSFSHDGWDTLASAISFADVVIQPDGKIIASGYQMVRYTVDGIRDTTFGTVGVVNYPCYRIAILPNGKIIAASGSYFQVLRLNSNGSLDTTFANAGRTDPLIYSIPFYSSYPLDMALQSDGKIILVGYIEDCPNTCYTSTVFIRYKLDGSLDHVECDWMNLSIEWPRYNGITITPKGSIIISFLEDHYVLNYHIFTYYNNGDLADCFVSNLMETTSLIAQPDGKVIATGFPMFGSYDFALVRCQNGIDSSFASNGLDTTDFSGGVDKTRSLAIQTDMKIIAAGRSGGNIALARYNNCGVSFKSVSPCVGSCSGSVSATQSFGHSPFTYLWSTGDTTSTIDSLCAGNYSVTVTDSTGCISSYSFTLNSPNAHAVSSPANCFGSCDGEAIASLSGGTPPYNYYWSNGDTTDIAFALCNGSYSVIITDSNLCADTAYVTVLQPQFIISSFTGVDVLCNGDCNGSFIPNVGGGTPPYTFATCGGQSLVADSLCAGNYCVITMDSHGCTAGSSFVVNEPPAIITSSSVQNPNCTGCYNGAIIFSVSGGIPPYSYNWVPHNGHISNDSLINLPAGIFLFSVTDANGCVTSFSNTLVDQPDLVRDLNSKIAFTLSPNPAHNLFIVSFSQPPKNAELTVLDLFSKELLSQSAVDSRLTTVDCRNLVPGIYIIQLKNEVGVAFKKLIIE